MIVATKRNNAALIRALRSSVTSLSKSKERISGMIQAEEERHKSKVKELYAMHDTVAQRLLEDEEKIKELSGSPEETKP